MRFDQIYENAIAYSTNGNAELVFTENNSLVRMRYLLDIIIDNNIVLSNVSSNGSLKSIGSIVNTSASTIGISLNNSRVTLIMSGIHTMYIKIKQGVLTEVRTSSVITPVTYKTIEPGYSFDNVKKLTTDVNNSSYNSKLTTLKNDMLLTINSLLDSNESITNLTDSYAHDNNTYPKFAYIDELNIGNISTYLDNSNPIISTDLLTNNSISSLKLVTSINDSIALANSSVQSIYINKKLTPEAKDINNVVNLNLAIDITSLKKNGIDSYSYKDTVDNSLATITPDTIDIQSKIINTNVDENTYFINYLEDGSYGYTSTDLFFKKEDNIKSQSPYVPEADDLLYSSLKTKSLLNGKVDMLGVQVEEVATPLFKKIKINNQGQIYEHGLISSLDLTSKLDKNKYYQKTGVKKVINTSRSTILFI